MSMWIHDFDVWGKRGGGGNRHLFVVGADEVENKAPVHERKQVIQEEGQTAVQPLHKLHILETERDVDKKGGEKTAYFTGEKGKKWYKNIRCDDLGIALWV